MRSSLQLHVDDCGLPTSLTPGSLECGWLERCGNTVAGREKVRPAPPPKWESRTAARGWKGGWGGKGSSSQYLDPREAPVAGQHNRAGTGAAGRKACASEHVGSVTVR